MLFTTTFLIFSLLWWLNLRESRVLLEQKSLDEAASLVSKTNQYLDLYTESIRSLFLFLKLEKEIDNKLLFAISDSFPLISETLYFIPDDGPVLSSRPAQYQVAGNDFSSAGVPFDSIGPELIWSEPHNSPISGKTVTFFMKLEQGIAVLEITIEVLNDKVIGQVNRKGITLHVTSGRNQTILYNMSGMFRYPHGENQYFREQLSLVPKGLSRSRVNDTEYSILRSESNNLGWSVFAFVDPEFFSSGLSVLNRQSATLGLILFILLVFLSIILSLIISRPVRQLASAMDQVRSLKHLNPIEYSYPNEFAVLVDAYNNMMFRINNLTNEKNEYEWKMLQSQIGPHFLYNTLACIGALAKRNRSAEVVWTIDSLVHLLRYSFDRNSSDVTLAEEIEVVKSYVAIQNMRYGNLFFLDVQVSSAALSQKIPALVLQPVIENSIFHGLNPDNRKGTIQITSEIQDQFLAVTVSDDGQGIRSEKLANLQAGLGSDDLSRAIENADYHRNGYKDRMSAIGLRNIHRRLQIHYGEPCGIQVSSVENHGTRVSLIIPYTEPTMP